MRKQLVGYITGTCDGNGHFTETNAYNASIKDAVPEIAGDYQFTLGKGGVAPDVTVTEITVTEGAADADLATPSTVSGDAVTKRAQFRDKAGALVDPVGFQIMWYMIVT